MCCWCVYFFAFLDFRWDSRDLACFGFFRSVVIAGTILCGYFCVLLSGFGWFVVVVLFVVGFRCEFLCGCVWLVIFYFCVFAGFVSSVGGPLSRVVSWLAF